MQESRTTTDGMHTLQWWSFRRGSTIARVMWTMNPMTLYVAVGKAEEKMDIFLDGKRVGFYEATPADLRADDWIEVVPPRKRAVK